MSKPLYKAVLLYAVTAFALNAFAQYNPYGQSTLTYSQPNTFNGYSPDGVLYMGGQKIGNPHQILHDAEIPSFMTITASRYTYTNDPAHPNYGQGTLAQMEAATTAGSDASLLLNRLYLTANNPYPVVPTGTHNNFQTYANALTNAQATGYKAITTDDGKAYAVKTLTAANTQAQNILVRELPNTSQFRAAADPAGGAVGVRVTQNGDAVAVANYMSTVTPYNFASQPNFGVYGSVGSNVNQYGNQANNALAGAQIGQNSNGSDCWYPQPCASNTTGYNFYNTNSDYNKPNPYFGVPFNGNEPAMIYIGGAGDQIPFFGNRNIEWAKREMDGYGTFNDRVYGWSEGKQILADLKATKEQNPDFSSFGLVTHSWAMLTGNNLTAEANQLGIRTQAALSLDGVPRIGVTQTENAFANYYLSVVANPATENRNASDTIASIGRFIGPNWTPNANETVVTPYTHRDVTQMMQSKTESGLSATASFFNFFTSPTTSTDSTSTTSTDSSGGGDSSGGTGSNTSSGGN
jgi:hypothetical protein